MKAGRNGEHLFCFPCVTNYFGGDSTLVRENIGNCQPFRNGRRFLRRFFGAMHRSDILLTRYRRLKGCFGSKQAYSCLFGDGTGEDGGTERSLCLSRSRERGADVAILEEVVTVGNIFSGGGGGRG